MNKFICRRIIASIRIFIICCLPFLSTAQALSLYDAVNSAIINYPQIQQRQSEVLAGRAHVNTIKGNHLPSLLLQDQLDMGTANALEGSYFPLGIVPSTSGSSPASPSSYSPNPGNVAISYLQWDFYNFGYYKAQTKEARAQLAVNEANLGSDKYLLTENIIALYLDWLKKYRLLQIQNENVLRAQVVLTAIRATVLSGLKPGVDSSTASAVYADARVAYLLATDEYNYDKIALSSYTGITLANITPDTTFINAAFLQNPPQVAEADTVPLNHPLLDVYQKQYDVQLADLNTISRKYLPHLGMDGAAWSRNSGISYTGTYPDNLSDGMPYNKYNYLFGLTLSYNLFDLKHRHNELVEGRYQAQALHSQFQTQQLTLDKMIQQANATYATTTEKLKELPIELSSAQQAYTQQLALYRSGLNTLIDVTNAQYVLLQAETNYVLTQDELLQILYVRAGLGGELDTFLQNFKK